MVVLLRRFKGMRFQLILIEEGRGGRRMVIIFILSLVRMGEDGIRVLVDM